MTFVDKILPVAGGVLVALGAVALMPAPVAVQADEQARQFEQNRYCFSASGADRWQGCR